MLMIWPLLLPRRWALGCFSGSVKSLRLLMTLYLIQKKSHLLIIRPKIMKNIEFPSFLLNGEKIEECEKVLYLGHIIRNDLTDDEDILRQRRFIFARGNALLRKFNVCSIEVKLELFRAYFSNIYCCQLWWNYSCSAMAKFQTSYHNVLKLFLGLSKFESTSQTCAAASVPSCGCIIRRMYFKFWSRLMKCQNCFVSSVFGSSLVYKSRIHRHWRKSLYVMYMA